jgi:phosphocarrier protein
MIHINRRRAVIEKIITVRNRAGIHARPAALISQTANKFKSEILMQKDTLTINAKSIMGVITMAAGYNTNIIVRADGEDEAEAVEALRSLFENKFEEE